VCKGKLEKKRKLKTEKKKKSFSIHLQQKAEAGSKQSLPHSAGRKALGLRAQRGAQVTFPQIAQGRRGRTPC